jgi:hypothetical protein
VTWLNTSVHSGFARSASEAMFPRLFPDAGWWCPSLNPAMGGARLWDLSGRQNWGTLTNMANDDWVVSGGKLALDFDGSNDHVTTTCPGVTTRGRAVSVWFRTSVILSSVGQYAGIVRWGTATSFPADQGKDFAVQFGNDANFGSTGFGVSQYGDGIGVTGFNDGRWHHGYIDSVGSLYSIYVDGVFRTSKTMTTNATAGTVTIGRNTYGGVEYFPGQLDDLRIYNRALTAGEVRQLWQIGRGNMPLRRRRRYAEQAAGGNRRRRVLLGAEC